MNVKLCMWHMLGRKGVSWAVVIWMGCPGRFPWGRQVWVETLLMEGMEGSTSQWGNSRDKASTWARRMLLRHSRAESTREDGERRPERQGPEGLELRTWLGYSGDQKPMKRWRGLSGEVPFTPIRDKSVHLRQVGGEWSWEVADWKLLGSSAYASPLEVEVIIVTFWKAKTLLWSFSVCCLHV